MRILRHLKLLFKIASWQQYAKTTNFWMISRLEMAYSTTQLLLRQREHHLPCPDNPFVEKTWFPSHLCKTPITTKSHVPHREIQFRRKSHSHYLYGGGLSNFKDIQSQTCAPIAKGFQWICSQWWNGEVPNKGEVNKDYLRRGEALALESTTRLRAAPTSSLVNSSSNIARNMFCEP